MPDPQIASRRAVLAAAAATAGLTIVGPGTASRALALASVNMELVEAAAQVEPDYGHKPALGATDHVILVQSALIAKGFSTSADGWYGNGTTSAYAAYQRSLGYTGLAANGLPGPSSLTSLGLNRYTVTNKITVGAKVAYSGVTLNTRTKSMVTAADGKVSWALDLTQGSYNPGGVGQSAGTHDGGGACDISVSGRTQTQIWQTVQALRTVGFAAWYRTPAEGDWAAHIHCIAVGDTDLPLSARDQVADYYVGKNGLASHAADTTPTAYRVPFTWWEKYSRA